MHSCCGVAGTPAAALRFNRGRIPGVCLPFIRWADSGEVPSWRSSTTAWAPGPSGSPRQPTNRSYGVTYFGTGNPQTARPSRSRPGVSLLSPGEDRQGVLPAAEPGRQCASPGHHARRPKSRRPRLPRRRRTPQRPLSGSLWTRWHQAEAGHRDGQAGALGVEGSAEDLPTYHDEHVPESSIEILGHSVGGITYRHCAHRAPLAFRAITTLPQPTAFSALLRGTDGECPCCGRRFADAG
jgi:hypothetical protein